MKINIWKIIMIYLFLLQTDGYQIKPTVKKFPKVSYTKIYDISYKKPIIIRQKKSYTLSLINEISKTIFNYFVNSSNFNIN